MSQTNDEPNWILHELRTFNRQSNQNKLNCISENTRFRYVCTVGTVYIAIDIISFITYISMQVLFECYSYMMFMAVLKIRFGIMIRTNYIFFF